MFWLHWQNWRWHLLSLSCLFWKLVWPVHVYLILLRNFNGYVGSLVRCAYVARKKHLLTWKIVNLCFSLYIVISFLSFIGIESAKKKGNACTKLVISVQDFWYRFVWNVFLPCLYSLNYLFLYSLNQIEVRICPSLQHY